MQLWQRPDILEQLLPNVDLAEVQKLRQEADKQLALSKFSEIAKTLEPLPTVEDLPQRPDSNLASDWVTIGKRSDLTDSQFQLLETAILAMKPWRKGPFRLFDYEIDSEWRSNLKWDRIAPALGELRGRKIIDVGCGNGYYMFRAAASDPALVLGLDPSLPFFYAFELMQRYLQMPNLQYDRLGAEDLHVFDQAFDIAMCMGVLYHRTGPIEILKNLRRSLRVGGFAIIESQSIPGDVTVALFPEDRYAKARNVFFVPTKDCLVNWAKRAGFKDIEVVSHTPVTTEEQRRTKLMDFESLADFLDSEDSSKTIEGYPAPYRTVIRGVRKFL